VLIDDVLTLIARHKGCVPPVGFTVEPFGPLTLAYEAATEQTAVWPTASRFEPITREHVDAVRARQREVGVPEVFEWVDDLDADLGTAAAESGLQITRYPLLVLDGEPVVASVPGVDVGIVGPDDPDTFAAVRAAVHSAFIRGGVDVGADDPPGHNVPPTERLLELMLRGYLVQAGAVDHATGEAYGGGAHIPRDTIDATEVVAIGVRPSVRRRGIGVALAGVLARHARDAGIGTIFLGAESDAVARIYERAGFVRVGTAGLAEPPAEST